MEFRDVVRRRKMVRNFEDRPVDPAAVDRILDCAVRAPSAGFSQGWHFLALTEPQDRTRFWDAAWPHAHRDGGPRELVMNAGLIVVPCSDKDAYLDRYAEPDKGWTDRAESNWPVPYWQIDTAFATMSMLLSVVDEGLAALFFSLQHEAAVKETFGIPERVEPIGALAIGHPAPDVPSSSLSRGRRASSQTIHRHRW